VWEDAGLDEFINWKYAPGVTRRTAGGAIENRNWSYYPFEPSRFFASIISRSAAISASIALILAAVFGSRW